MWDVKRKPFIFCNPRFTEVIQYLIHIPQRIYCHKVFKETGKSNFEERITTTAMRKEAATLSAACGFSEQQVDLVANFLGHTNTVHQKHHRLPESTLEKNKFGLNLTLPVLILLLKEKWQFLQTESQKTKGEESQNPKEKLIKQVMISYLNHSKPGLARKENVVR